ncbi:TonB-dependent receptor [Dyadobacter sp. CY312]|uniref:TonB-dependent receptor n=1 Tax=Dyadobacter sp. CY312 TaxID=2907303 RepID=UPI001F35322A|nr:TonB-dependent receptor [Dyadobacter sp. CY312]MCE7040462.1 TonB-dependent receptor [Dyadobacter sp. CY312]
MRKMTMYYKRSKTLSRMALGLGLVLLFFGISQATSARAQEFLNQKISVSFQQGKVEKVLEYLESKAGVNFLYSPELIDANRQISFEMPNTKFADILTGLTQKLQVSYEISGKTIILKPQATQKPKATSSSTSAVDRTVTGVVLDDTGEPLPGVSIQAKGSTVGTSTGLDGKFNFVVGDDITTLIFSYIGYITQEVALTNSSDLNITLAPDVKSLSEVVVVGYGTVKKRDLTGSVGSVDAKAIAGRGTTSAMAAIQGAVAGVDISTNSVRPGGGFAIQIRGQNSLAGGNPLYVVDGVVTGDINFLNPADIEQIDILKDASSTAIYGSRGSNGVVLVKTKNAGTPGSSRTSITYDGYYSVRELARVPDFMDGRQWVDFRTSGYYQYANGAYSLPSKSVILQNSPLLEQRLYDQNYEDWLKLGTRSGQQQNHYIGISGNSDKLSYNLGLGYQKEEGNFINEDLSRYTFKLSAEHRASKFFSAGGSVNMTMGINNSGSQNGYRDVLRMPNILSAYDDNGVLIEQPGIAASIQGTGNFTSSPNPLLEINSGTEELRRYDILGSIFAEFRPLDGLSFRSSLLPRFNRSRTGRYYGVVNGNRSQDHAFQSNTENFEFTWDNVLNYTKSFEGKHNINVSLIQSAFRTRYERIQAASNNLPYDSQWYNLFSGTFVNGSSNTNYAETSLLSYAGRANYDYKGKYFVTGTLRYDGSSKLRDKWQAFPSAALAWRISEEDFAKANFLSDLKARFSVGFSGNNNGISAYGAQQTPQTGSLVWYDFDGTAVSGFAPGRPVNQSVTWEKTREINFGIDYSLFNYRVSGTIDLYDKLSDGLLMSRALAIESGVPSMTDNIGSVSNKGIELSLKTVNVRTDKFEWSTDFVFSHNRNAIESLYGKKEDVPGEARFIGESINVIYDYRLTGIWKMAEAEEALKWGQQPGQAKALDVNNDGRITAADDRVILGSPDPTWTGSVTSTVRLQNWDFALNFFTRQGVFVSDRFLEEFGPQNNQRGRPKINFDYYVPPGVDRYDWNTWGTGAAGQPTATWGTSGAGNENAEFAHYVNRGPYGGNNAMYTNASFVKLRNITLGYTLPTKTLERIKVKSLRVYGNVLNPFTFTKYKGWDPEYATTALDNGNGPSNITYQFGVNVKF